MSNNKLCKGKHLRIEDRLIIEYGLDQNYTLKEISEIIRRIQLPSLKRLSEIDFLKWIREKKRIYNRANIEEVAPKQAYALILVVSNVRNVVL